MRSATDAHDVSAKQDRVNAADHERKHTQQRHCSRACGVRAHKGDSDDLDREKRNERKNVQPNVFHSSYLLKFFGSGEAISQSPRLQLHDSISRACCKIHNSERYILRFRFNSKI